MIITFDPLFLKPFRHYEFKASYINNYGANDFQIISIDMIATPDQYIIL